MKAGEGEQQGQPPPLGHSGRRGDLRSLKAMPPPSCQPGPGHPAHALPPSPCLPWPPCPPQSEVSSVQSGVQRGWVRSPRPHSTEAGGLQLPRNPPGSLTHAPECQGDGGKSWAPEEAALPGARAGSWAGCPPALPTSAWRGRRSGPKQPTVCAHSLHSSSGPALSGIFAPCTTTTAITSMETGTSSCDEQGAGPAAGRGLVTEVRPLCPGAGTAPDAE